MASELATIENYLQPQTKSQMRSFLGLANYYRRFIPCFAEKATALIDAIRGKVQGSIRWPRQMEGAFKAIKRALCNDLVVVTPDFSKIFILQMDASETAIGAVLCQDQEGVERPIAFASKKLNTTETRYSTIERECLVIKWAIKYFQYY